MYRYNFLAGDSNLRQTFFCRMSSECSDGQRMLRLAAKAQMSREGSNEPAVHTQSHRSNSCTGSLLRNYISLDARKPLFRVFD